MLQRIWAAIASWWRGRQPADPPWDETPVPPKCDREEELPQSKHYKRKDLVAFVIRNPKSPHHDVDDRSSPHSTFCEQFKSLLCTHALYLGGLHSGYTIYFDRKEIGTEENQLSAIFPEFPGKLTNLFFHAWKDLYSKHKDSNVELYSFDVILVEPTADDTQVLEAWGCFNVFPMSYSGSGSKREMRELPPYEEGTEYTVDFHSQIRQNDFVDKTAEKLYYEMRRRMLQDDEGDVSDPMLDRVERNILMDALATEIHERVGEQPFKEQ